MNKNDWCGADFPFLRKVALSVFLVCVLFALVGCGSRPDAASGLIRVVATTTIVGDMVQRVGGEDIELVVLLPDEADPHDYILKPADLAQASRADIIFINGAGLEGAMERALRRAAPQALFVSLAERIPLRHFDDPHHHHHHHHHGHDHHDCDHGEVDPHFWADPNMVMIWVDHIADVLTQAVPDSSDAFITRAQTLRTELEALHHWIEEQVETIPSERRLLVTDHLSLGYFADRYGFTQKGVIIRSFDSMAQPSAREIASLIDTLRTYDVPALFVGASVNPALAQRISEDTGMALATLFSGALTGPDGDAPDYFAYTRYNVSTLVTYLGATP